VEHFYAMFGDRIRIGFRYDAE